MRERLEEEVGDLFFVLVNIARYLALDPESALRKTNRKFRRRFQWMEQRLHEDGTTPEQATMDELESLWQQAKRQEKQIVTADNVVIRHCHGLDELRACVALQKEVWNFADAELVPLRMFVVAEKVGGQVMGAFDGDGWSVLRFRCRARGPATSILHSHMLAVRKDYRNSGLGRRLKLLQRDDALARGIELIEWTFDPLEIKNAYLNIEKLGAIARRYNINQYGITSSPLQGGLPSDRLIAEWWLKSKRVETLLATGKNPAFSQKRQRLKFRRRFMSGRPRPETAARRKEVQERNREEFLAAFGEDSLC